MKQFNYEHQNLFPHHLIFFSYNKNPEGILNGGMTNGHDTKTTGKIKKWRIENSWGEDRNEKGFISMTTEW